MFFGNSIRVLVVDDEPSICAMLRRSLSGVGYDVVTAHSGEEAQTRVMTEQFDAMVLDLRMKDIRGDVVYYVALGAQPHLRFTTVFMTGDIGENADRLIKATGCPMLAKPSELSELLRLLHAFHPRAHQATA